MGISRELAESERATDGVIEADEGVLEGPADCGDCTASVADASAYLLVGRSSTYTCRKYSLRYSSRDIELTIVLGR